MGLRVRTAGHPSGRLGLGRLAVAFLLGSTPSQAATPRHDDWEGFADGTVSASIKASPGEGDCAFDLYHPNNQHLKTGYEQGVARATRLIAMYVPCGQLQSAFEQGTGAPAWLPEWMTYEANTVALDKEQLAHPFATIARLCLDARRGHPAPMAADFNAMVDLGHTGLKAQRRVIYFGVIAEDKIRQRCAASEDRQFDLVVPKNNGWPSVKVRGLCHQ